MRVPRHAPTVCVLTLLLPLAATGSAAEGDYVAMWNSATATHQGELFGAPPSGKQIQLKDFHFFRFRAGKIVEHWNQVAHLIAQD